MADDVNLQLYAAPFVGANAVSVNILDPAPELLEVARDSLKEASLNGTLKLAANAAFTVDKFDEIQARLNQFLTGESAPSVEWADFDADAALGAYLIGENRILLNRSLANDHSTLENVRRIWSRLDDVTSEDSQGDRCCLCCLPLWSFSAIFRERQSPGSGCGKLIRLVASPVLGGAGGTLAYRICCSAVIGPALTLSDGDNNDIIGATVEITSGCRHRRCVGNCRKTEFLVRGIAVGCVDSDRDEPCDYKTALESITYDNTNDDDPDTSNRTITWIVTITGESSSAVTSTITVAGVNDAPTDADAGTTLPLLRVMCQCY